MANQKIKQVNISGVDYDIEPAQTEELVIIAQNPTLTPGAESTIGHVGGVNFKVTMPEFPDITISTGKTETSTADTVTAISKLEQNTADGHEITVSKTTLPTKAYVDKIATGHVKYLGTVSALTGLSTTAGQGDFYRVSTEFTFGSEKAHVGDIILATKDNPDQTITDWDLIHAEIDSNTWVANSASAAGYVAKGSGKAHQVWKTDENGNPGWRRDEDTEYLAGTGLSAENTTFNVIYGTTAGTACEGNDSRLSDARTPTDHSHGNITSGGLILGGEDGIVITDSQGKITVCDDVSERQLVHLSNVTSDIQDQLDGKAPTDHGTHVTADTVKSALGTSSSGTKFLKEDGTWASPADEKVKQNKATTEDANLPILLAMNNSGAVQTGTVKKADLFRYNPGTTVLKTPNIELTGNIQLQGSIKFKGSKSTSEIIRFIDNKADVNGNGIAIGGGGTTVIGGGESASLIVPDSGGNERMVITNDQAIEFYAGCQSGLESAKSMTFEASGNLNVPQITASKTEATTGQDSLIRSISTQTATDTDQVWRGRIIAGAKNKTFLLGVYRNMCGIGAHSWTDAFAASGAAWEDIYFNPDGSAKLYFGGSGWTKNSSVMKIENAIGGVYINVGTFAAPTWKKVPAMSYNSNTGVLTIWG